jgi:hypothetical protein
MNYNGIKGPLIKWFENYLYQRKQKVITGQHHQLFVKSLLANHLIKGPFIPL